MTKKKPAPKKTKKGRPSLYTEALAAKICRGTSTDLSAIEDGSMSKKPTTRRKKGTFLKGRSG